MQSSGRFMGRIEEERIQLRLWMHMEVDDRQQSRRQHLRDLVSLEVHRKLQDLCIDRRYDLGTSHYDLDQERQQME